MRTFILILLFLLSCFSFGEYNYRQLILKEYEDMEKIVNKQIALSRKAAKKDGEAFEGALSEIKKALSTVFMHPTDGTNSTLLSLLRAEVINYTPFWKIIMDITRDSLNIFESSASSTLQLASHLYILENVLSYIQNRSPYQEEFNSILKLIVKAKIEIPNAVSNHRFMTAGAAKPHSPSLKARTLLKKRLKMKKEKERKEREWEKIKEREKKKQKNKTQIRELKKKKEEKKDDNKNKNESADNDKFKEL